jgi:hypothetical protein
MSTLKVSTISPLGTDATKTITLGESGGTLGIASGAKTSGFGKVGQVLQVVKTDTFDTTSTSYVDITGLSLDITPTSTSSKILINVSGVGGNDSSHTRVSLRLLEDSTAIVDHAVGLASDSQLAGFAINFLSSPSTTSSITYKLQLRQDNAGNGAQINRSDSDTAAKGITTITLMEILD